MTEPQNQPILDPHDWDDFRANAHHMLDDMIDNMQTVRDRPVWQAMPQSTHDLLAQSVPDAARPLDEVYAEFKEHILPYPMGNAHPRFWGWVIGSGLPVAVLAELLGTTMNPNTGGGDHVANEVEKQVIDWCKQMFGFPEEASGIMVSGGSMANFVGLAVARHNKAPFDIRKEGLQHQHAPMTMYASEQYHSSLAKSVNLLGIGDDLLRRIPVNADFEIDLDALRARIEADREAGMLPICLIGALGTVNTGATDDLAALAEIAREFDMWFHIDGAFGAMALLTPQYAHLIPVVGQADSIAFDFHKWMYIPYEAACVIIRNREQHFPTFTEHPPYLQSQPRGVGSGTNWFNDYGLQLSRDFKSLKMWFALKVHGLEAFRESISGNIAQATYLADRVNAHDQLELLAPAPMNIVCFRYVAPDRSIEQLNALNQEILMQLQEQGIAVPTYTTLNGKYAIRCAITNHRSTFADFDILVDAVVRLGDAAVNAG